MRVVLDSNVLISGAIGPGMCDRVARHCLVRHQVVLSEYILGEVRRNLIAKVKLSIGATDALLRPLRGRATIVEPAPVERGACRHAKDIPILGTAVAGQALCIVTGDQDLLVLKSFRGVKVVGQEAGLQRSGLAGNRFRRSTCKARRWSARS